MVILGMYYGIGFTTLKHFFQLRSQEGFARAHLLDDTVALGTLRGVPKILAQAGWLSRKHPKILRIDGFRSFHRNRKPIGWGQTGCWIMKSSYLR